MPNLVLSEKATSIVVPAMIDPTWWKRLEKSFFDISKQSINYTCRKKQNHRNIFTISNKKRSKYFQNYVIVSSGKRDLIFATRRTDTVEHKVITVWEETWTFWSTFPIAPPLFSLLVHSFSKSFCSLQREFEMAQRSPNPTNHQWPNETLRWLGS